MSVLYNRSMVLGLVLSLGGCAGTDGLSTGTLAPAAATRIKSEFDCVGARHDLSALVTSLTALEPLARQQLRMLPVTAVATLQRLAEPRGPGLAAVAQFEDERNRYTVLATTTTQKACPIKDIDETFQAAVEKMTAFRSGK